MTGTGPDRELPEDMLGLDPSDPETREFADHLDRMRTSHPNYTVEGYLANVGEFANSANRANGHRRLTAWIVVALILLGVLYAAYEALGTIFGTLF